MAPSNTIRILLYRCLIVINSNTIDSCCNIDHQLRSHTIKEPCIVSSIFEQSIHSLLALCKSIPLCSPTVLLLK